MDRLTGMAIFAQVVETKSFSGAADRLGLSKSTVSKHVTRLEDRLGARLLHRTTRRLSLTEAGTAFYQRCVRVVEEAEGAERAVSRLRGVPRGTLRVNAPLSFGQLHIVPALPEFLARYPDVRIDLSLTDRAVDLVEGAFDVTVRIAQLADSSLMMRRLAPLRLVVCGTPAYLARRGVPRTPSDLARHDCLTYTYLLSAGEWRFRGPRGQESVRVSGTLRSNSGDALLAAALDGLGLIHLPTFIVWRALEAGALVPVLQAYRGPEGSVHALYAHDRHLPPKVRVFVNFLAARFGPHPYWDQVVPGTARSGA